MRSVALFLLVMGCLIVVGLLASPAVGQGQTEGPDQWRYTFHNGEWWYWLPEGRWVYWRADRWNDYNPPTSLPTSSSPAVAGNVTGPTHGNQSLPNSDIRPFYGRAQSQWGYNPAVENGVGPFYGHAMPGEVFGTWGGRRFSIRPFYGHAASSYGD
jgi:hypothetical protein